MSTTRIIPVSGNESFGIINSIQSGGIADSMNLSNIITDKGAILEQSSINVQGPVFLTSAQSVMRKTTLYTPAASSASPLAANTYFLLAVPNLTPITDKEDNRVFKFPNNCLVNKVILEQHETNTYGEIGGGVTTFSCGFDVTTAGGDPTQQAFHTANPLAGVQAPGGSTNQTGGGPGCNRVAENWTTGTRGTTTPASDVNYTIANRDNAQDLPSGGAPSGDGTGLSLWDGAVVDQYDACTITIDNTMSSGCVKVTVYWADINPVTGVAN
jgi:hypothetical protein